MSDILLVEEVKPSAPGANQWLLYFKSDGNLYKQDESGVETAFGSSTSDFFLINFAFGDASPEAIGTLAANKLVRKVSLFVRTAFDASGIALSIGKSGATSDLMATTQVDPLTIAEYSTSPLARYIADTPLILTIAGSGGTMGAGTVVIEYEP